MQKFDKLTKINKTVTVDDKGEGVGIEAINVKLTMSLATRVWMSPLTLSFK